MWLLPRVSQPVQVQILSRVESFTADEAFEWPFPRVAPHVPFQALRAGEAALTHRAPERLLSGVGTSVPTKLRGLEEAHLTARAAVRLIWLLFVGLFVSFAVTRFSEPLPTDGAGERLLTSVHSLMADQFVKFTERLRAVRALMRHLRFLRVRAFMPLQLRRPVEHFSTVRTGMLVGPVVAVLVSDQLFLLSEALLTILTLVERLGLPGMDRFVPFQLGRSVKHLTTGGARVTLV